MVLLYHYTTKSGLEGINKDGVIRRSTKKQKDACYGPGVYLTSLNPNDYDKEFIAKNNWLDGGSSKRGQGHLDYYIEIDIDVNDRRLSPDGFEDGRNVYRFNGDIHYDEFKWRSGNNSDWSPLQIAAAVGLGALAVGGLAMLGKYVYDKCTEEPDCEKERKEKEKQKPQANQADGCAQQ